MKRLNEDQVNALLKPINPKRVKTDGGQSHVPAYDVAAHLTRVLGFAGWDTELLSSTLLFEDSEQRTGKNKDGTSRAYLVWTIGYSATVRLTIKDSDGQEISHWENGACGDAVNQPSRADAHHLAMTTAISTAMKRCAAFGLGDQFGLSLYNKGNMSSLIGRTLVMPGATTPANPDLESHIPVPESLGNDERQIEPEIVESSPTITQLPRKGAKTPQEPSKQDSAPSPLVTPLQREIREHTAYSSMVSTEKGGFLSDAVGYEVKSITSLSDDDCEQVLAKLRTL